jgi:hypothetical protein
LTLDAIAITRVAAADSCIACDGGLLHLTTLHLHCLLCHLATQLLHCVAPCDLQLRSRPADPLKNGLDNGSSHFSCNMAEVEVLKRELDVTTSTAINVLDHNALAPNATLQTWSRLRTLQIMPC